MPALHARDRLQPVLLDRLLGTDRLLPGDADDGFAISRRQLRAAVLRDLGWLLNATRLEPGRDTPRAALPWPQAEHARNSVLNYGIPCLCGTPLSPEEMRRIERWVVEAICRFEPRIDAKTLHVEAGLRSRRQQPSALQLTIQGRLWAQPAPIDLVIAAQVDADSGAVRLQDVLA